MARAPFQVLVLPFRRVGKSVQFCVLRRSDDGNWQWVAGGGENSEDPVTAAQREAREELGLAEVRELYPLSSQAAVPVEVFAARSAWPSELRTIPEYAFAVECRDDVVLSCEHTELRWCSFEEAQRTLRYDSNRIALRELAERLKHNTLRPTHAP